MTTIRRTGGAIAFITAVAFALTAASPNPDYASRVLWTALAVMFAISGLRMLRARN